MLENFYMEALVYHPVVQFLMLFVLATGVSWSGTEWTIARDERVKLTLLDDLRSGRSKRGTRVLYDVAEDVMNETGTVLIRKGTKAYGVITQSRAADIRGVRGILEIQLDHTTAVDGSRVSLSGKHHISGPGIRGMVNAGIWLVSWPIWFVRGDNVVLNSGITTVAKVEDEVTVAARQAARPNTHRTSEYYDDDLSQVSPSHRISRRE